MKGRNFSILLYPDSNDYNFDIVLNKIISLCDFREWSYYYILHNEDIKEDGSRDKNHYHIFINIPSDKSDTTINFLANEFGIESRWIEKMTKPNLCILYLAHESPNSKTKYNYDWHMIETNNRSKLEKVFASDEEQRNIYAIISYIESVGYIKLSDFTKFILNNNLWSYYRRSGYIINLLIKEHNLKYVKYSKKEEFLID